MTPSNPTPAAPLAPCPFCGNDAKTVMAMDHDWKVECEACPVRTDWMPTESAVVEAWNRRTPSGTLGTGDLEAEVERLREIINHGCLKCGWTSSEAGGKK